MSGAPLFMIEAQSGSDLGENDSERLEDRYNCSRAARNGSGPCNSSMAWWICMDDRAHKRLIVYPGEERYSAGAGLEAVGLTELMHELRLSGR